MDLTLPRLPAVPARLPVPLAASLAAVALAHAGILLQPWGAHAVTPSATAMQVRMIRVAAPGQPAPTLALATVAQAPAAELQASVEPVLPAVLPGTADAPPPEVARAPLAADVPLSSGADQPSSDLQDYYRPRSELTTPPEPIVMIQVLFPASFQEKGEYSAQLSLFIDETGHVRRVRVDTLGLPPALQEAASQAFLNAYFQPGRVDGQAVKSLMRVEVAFENPPA